MHVLQPHARHVASDEKDAEKRRKAVRIIEVQKEKFDSVVLR